MATFLEMLVPADASILRSRYFVFAWQRCTSHHAEMAVRMKSVGNEEMAQWHLARASRAWKRLQTAREVNRKLWEAQGKGNKYEH